MQTRSRPSSLRAYVLGAGARWGWLVFAGVAFGAGACSRLVSGASQVAFHAAPGFLAAAAIAAGVHRYRPRPVGAWVLLATAVFLLAGGDLAFRLDELNGRVVLFSTGDWLYLTALPLLALALARFGTDRSGSRRASRMLFVDSAALFAASLLLVWFFVFNRQFDGHHLAAADRLLVAAFPVLDLLLLALAGRLLLTGAGRLPAFALLVAGSCFGFAGDLIWRGFLQLSDYGSFLVSGSYYVSYALIGAAALHPSMVKVAAAGGREQEVMPLRRLLLLAACAASLVVVVVLRHGQVHEADDVVFLGIAAAVIPGLILYRFTDLLAVSERLARRAERAAGRLEAVLDASPLPVAVLDPGGQVLLWNHAAEAVSGWTAREVIGAKPPMQPVAGERRLARFREEARSGQYLDRIELGLRRRDGEARRIEISSAPVRNGDELEALVAVFADVTDERQRQEEISFLAAHDSLTGLFNRETFHSRLDAALAAAQETGLPLAVAVIDVDNFKLINDTAGHLIGDQVLRELARLVRENARDRDVCGRVGGDEFGLLLVDCDLQEAAQVAERIVEAARDFRLPLEHGSIDVTLSLGVYAHEAGRDRASTAEETFVRADAALYAAKQQGRNRAVPWNSVLGSTQQLDDLRQSSRRIKDALGDGRIIVHLQPIIDVQSGEVVFHEALSRMVDERGDLLEPVDFLPHAQRLGLIEMIDANAIRQAVALLELDPALRIFVNLDPASLTDDTLVREVVSTLESRPHLGGRLGIERTERASLGDLAATRLRLKRLKAAGCLLAIDDFGTGFSSFEHLRSLPVDLVKIGNGFIKGLGTDPVSSALFDAIVASAHALGKEVVAEEVEDAETARALVGRGVEYAQGYLFGRPQPHAAEPAARRREKDRAAPTRGAAPFPIAAA